MKPCAPAKITSRVTNCEARNSDMADDPVIAAWRRLRAEPCGNPARAAAWAADAAVVALNEPELLEHALPHCLLPGFWPEVIRCCLAIGAGREPPPPLPDWIPPKVNAMSTPARQKKPAPVPTRAPG